jgi:hypothetical protein
MLLPAAVLGEKLDGWQQAEKGEGTRSEIPFETKYLLTKQSCTNRGVERRRRERGEREEE